jgi:gliding motility-associated-like protein
MKYCLFIVSCLFYTINIIAQNKQGVNWVSGGSIVFVTNFDSNTIKNTMYIDSTIGWGIYSVHSNSCISDSNGNLQFFTDGMSVYGNDYKLMDGGYHLAPNSYFDYYSGIGPCSQTSIILPVGEKKYFLFTPMLSDKQLDAWKNATNNDSAFYDLFWYNIIDMNANNGMGKVVQSKIPLIENGYLSKPEMMAVRHANGRDWWLLKGKYNSIGFHTFLVSSKGVEDNGIQHFPRYGQDYDWDLDGQCVFSRDGSMFATVTGHRSTINLFDFDRCSGKLSNQKAINVPILPDNNPNDSTEIEFRTTVGIAFSSNQKFLYVNGICNIMQYEIGENDSSKAWTYLNKNTSYVSDYTNMYLAPNDKIYLGNWSGLEGKWSVINKPNEKGFACNFTNKSFSFPLWYGATTPPCMPNYRLGVLQGSECDTIGNEPPIEPPFTNVSVVLPNAFSPNGDNLNDYFHILNVAKLVQEKVEFKEVVIYNRLGNRVFSSQDINFQWDGNKMANDTYFYYIRYKTKEGNNKVEKGDVILIR